MNKPDDTALLLGQLTRIADALERKHPIDMAPDALPQSDACLLYTSPSPRDRSLSRMPSSA